MNLFDINPQDRIPRAHVIPEVNEEYHDSDYSTRRAYVLQTWQSAFQESRRTGKPPKYEIGLAEAVPLVAAGILMYISNPQPTSALKLENLLNNLEVGGYRMGRTRAGKPWASVFIRNVQYSLSKYIPTNIKYPELTLLALALRPNMHIVHQFIHGDMNSPNFLERVNRDGCQVYLIRRLDMPVFIRIQYLEFEYTSSLEDFVTFFNRQFDRNFIAEVERRRVGSAIDSGEDILMLMDE